MSDLPKLGEPDYFLANHPGKHYVRGIWKRAYLHPLMGIEERYLLELETEDGRTVLVWHDDKEEKLMQFVPIAEDAE